MKLKGVLGKFADTSKNENKKEDEEIKKETRHEMYLQYIQRIGRKYGW